MLNKEEIENKNLLQNADFGQGESKSITNFLETKCNKCGNKIQFRLAIKNIKDVEEYIEQLETKLNKYESREQKLIEKLEEDIREETGYAKWVDSNTKIISSAVTTMISKRQYAQEILEILKN